MNYQITLVPARLSSISPQHNPEQPSASQEFKTMYLSKDGISTALSIYLPIYLSIKIVLARTNPSFSSTDPKETFKGLIWTPKASPRHPAGLPSDPEGLPRGNLGAPATPRGSPRDPQGIPGGAKLRKRPRAHPLVFKKCPQMTTYVHIPGGPGPPK